jgi:hypothetical protein
MSPQRSRSKTGKYHLYYVSQARIQKLSATVPRPVPAPAVEEIVRDRLTCLARLIHQQCDDAGCWTPLEGQELRQVVQDQIARVEIHPGQVIVNCHAAALARELKAKHSQLDRLVRPVLPPDDLVTVSDTVIQIAVPVRLPLRGGLKRVVGWKPGGWTAPQVRQDPVLIRGLAQAHEWRELILKGQVRSLDELAKRVKLDRKTVQRTLRLAFLAPDIQKQILQGHQPLDITLTSLIERELLPLWSEQRQQLHS